MKQLLILSSFLFLLLSASAQTVKVYVSDSILEKDGKEYYVHFVTQGQTVYAIAKAYDVSIDEIYFENPEAREGLNVDQGLLIPLVNKETELNKELKVVKFEFFYHLVKSGESFRAIAESYSISPNQIIKANPEIHEPLREGEYIKIPVDNTFAEQGDEVLFNPDIPVIPGYRHIVVKGETPYGIAKKYNVTVEQLKAVNPGMLTTIEIGDRLRVPDSTGQLAEEAEVVEVKEEPQEPLYYSHNVKKKETLYSISRLYGVSLQELYDSNPGLKSTIAVGQVIQVPNTTIDKPYIIYTASKKIKINKVAKLYQIPASKIAKENPSLSNRILPGQKVRIPVGAKARIAEDLPEEKPKPEEIEELVVIEKPVTLGCEKQVPSTNQVFKVALMVPFYLEQADSLDLGQFMQSTQDDFLPFRFLNFYEGSLIAIDSLRKQGYNIKLYVYDVDQSITKTAKVLQNPELRKMDLIIGPFQRKSFDQVALFAGNFNIPIVNPFSFREEVVTKYKSAIKVKSDTKYQADLVTSLVANDYENAKVYFITHTNYQGADETGAIEKKVAQVVTPSYKVPNTDLHNLAIGVAYRDEEYEGEGPLPLYNFEGQEINADMLSTLPEDSTLFSSSLIRINYYRDSLYPFYETASPLRQNLVIIYGESKAFVMDVMNRLNEHRDTFNIQLIGMPTLERFNNLDLLQSNNMNLTYFATNYVNHKSDRVQDFIYTYRNKYHTDPGIYGMTGFDITYYFVEQLVSLGFRMRACIEQYPGDMLINNFRLENVPHSNNYQNSYWNVLRYYNYNRLKLPDPLPIDNIND